MNNYDFYAGHSDSVKKLEGGGGELCAKFFFYPDVKKNGNIDYIITNREKRRFL
jgi:hypothetical protein